jgi:hypothetical protein
MVAIVPEELARHYLRHGQRRLHHALPLFAFALEIIHESRFSASS